MATPAEAALKDYPMPVWDSSEEGRCCKCYAKGKRYGSAPTRCAAPASRRSQPSGGRQCDRKATTPEWRGHYMIPFLLHGRDALGPFVIEDGVHYRVAPLTGLEDVLSNGALFDHARRLHRLGGGFVEG